MDAIKSTSEPEKISSLLGLTAQKSMKLAFSGVDLQSADAYFNLGTKRLTKEGKYMFMSTINHVHGVRTQKGKNIIKSGEGRSMMN